MICTCGVYAGQHKIDCPTGKRNAKLKARRQAKEEALKSLGLKKVKGALGGVYWE